MRDTIKSLTAQNGGLRNELGQNTLPPPPAMPAPSPRALSKRKRTGPQSSHYLAKQARDTSPTSTLMHSKHAGPSVPTALVQPPPTTSELSRGDAEVIDYIDYQGGVLDFLDTWVAGGLGLGGFGLGVGLGLPQAPQSPCEFVSVGHVWTPISSSACSVCSFLFFFTSINILCFQQGVLAMRRVISCDRVTRCDLLSALRS
jgi:hypothetical protein